RRARHRRHEHARRPHRGHRRPRLGAADGCRPTAFRNRALAARRSLEQLGLRPVPRRRRIRHDARHRGHGPHRLGDRAPCARLLDADPLSQPFARGERGRARRAPRRARRAARERRPRRARRSLHAADASPDRRTRTRAHEAGRGAGEHRARRHRRRRRARAGASYRPDRRRRPRCLRERTAGPSGAARRAQRRAHAAHRERHAQLAARDGDARRRAPDRVGRRPAAAHAGGRLSDERARDPPRTNAPARIEEGTRGCTARRRRHGADLRDDERVGRQRAALRALGRFRQPTGLARPRRARRADRRTAHRVPRPHRGAAERGFRPLFRLNGERELIPTLAQLGAAILFATALVHTFSAKAFERFARRYPSHAGIWHLLGEVEVVFGFWAMVLVVYLAVVGGYGEALHYVESRNYTEPMFVFVIMVVAASRPILRVALTTVERGAALLPMPRAMAIYFLALFLLPLLGSFITEPAAMTLAALLLRDRFYSTPISSRLKYATIGVLFVNISIGGTLTPFAAPPVLMVAAKWEWTLPFMLEHFGWRSALACLINAGAVTLLFAPELRHLSATPSSGEPLPPVPWPLTLVHLLFLLGVVVFAH